MSSAKQIGFGPVKMFPSPSCPRLLWALLLTPVHVLKWWVGQGLADPEQDHQPQRGINFDSNCLE